MQVIVIKGVIIKILAYRTQIWRKKSFSPTPAFARNSPHFLPHRITPAKPHSSIGFDPRNCPKRYLRMVPKLKPVTRCFWIRTPRMTTGMVMTVPIAACGP